jgi:hypothetical protein
MDIEDQKKLAAMLRHVFAMPYEKVGKVCGRSPETIRYWLHEHVRQDHRERHRRYEARKKTAREQAQTEVDNVVNLGTDRREHRDIERPPWDELKKVFR